MSTAIQDYSCPQAHIRGRPRRQLTRSHSDFGAVGPRIAHGPVKRDLMQVLGLEGSTSALGSR